MAQKAISHQVRLKCIFVVIRNEGTWAQSCMHILPQPRVMQLQEKALMNIL